MDCKRRDDFKRRIHEQLRQNRNAIWIGKVPMPTKKAFIQLAEREFNDDYGFTLKWLMDSALSDAKWEVLNERITAIENKLSEAEKPKEEVRTMLDGKTQIRAKR